MNKDQGFINFFVGLLLAVFGVSFTDLFGWKGMCYPGVLCNLYFVACFSIIMYLLFFTIPNTITKMRESDRAAMFMRIDLEPGKTDYKQKIHDLVVVNNVPIHKEMKFENARVFYREKCILKSPNIVRIPRYHERTMSFIVYRPEAKIFLIKDAPYTFGPGMHQFTVAIHFSPPTGSNMYAKWFDVTVFYTAPDYFNIQIRPT
jgi:hypothetical protein